MWLCTGCDQVGYYREVVSGIAQVQGSVFRNYAIRGMIAGSFLLDPVNIFLYTWQSLPVLEQEEKNIWLKNIYKYYRIVAVWIIPAAFYGLFAGVVYSNGK